MTHQTQVREALDDWRTAERELDGGDRDADYGRLWSEIEDGRQAYQRAVADATDPGDAPEDDER